MSTLSSQDPSSESLDYTPSMVAWLRLGLFLLTCHFLRHCMVLRRATFLLHAFSKLQITLDTIRHLHAGCLQPLLILVTKAFLLSSLSIYGYDHVGGWRVGIVPRLLHWRKEREDVRKCDRKSSHRELTKVDDMTPGLSSMEVLQSIYRVCVHDP
jgi:hypothetical protein